MKSTNEIMSDWLKETSQPLNTPASRAFWRVLLLRDRYSEELQTSLAHDKQSKDKFSKLVRKANEMIARFDKNLSSLTKAVKPIPQHVPAAQTTQVPRAETTTQPLNHAPAEAPKAIKPTSARPVDKAVAELIKRLGTDKPRVIMSYIQNIAGAPLSDWSVVGDFAVMKGREAVAENGFCFTMTSDGFRYVKDKIKKHGLLP